jgi:hypothetical protein
MALCQEKDMATRFFWHPTSFQATRECSPYCTMSTQETAQRIIAAHSFSCELRKLRTAFALIVRWFAIPLPPAVSVALASRLRGAGGVSIDYALSSLHLVHLRIIRQTSRSKHASQRQSGRNCPSPNAPPESIQI